MSADSQPKVAARGGLALRTWGDESVVFNPSSGNTHLLDFVATEGLVCLQEAALDRFDLCRRLAARLNVEPDQQLIDYVDRLIARFDELGLLERVDS